MKHMAENANCQNGMNGMNGMNGLNGEPGSKGAKGDTGAQGARGVKGDTGAQGARGVKGDTGAQGARGAKGDTGAEGAQGAQGAKGDTGDAELKYWTEAIGTSASGKSFTQFAPRNSNATVVFASNGNRAALVTNNVYVDETGNSTVNLQTEGNAGDTGTGTHCALVGGRRTRLFGNYNFSMAADSCLAIGNHNLVAGRNNNLDGVHCYMNGTNNILRPLNGVPVRGPLHSWIAGQDNLYEYTEDASLNYLYSPATRNCQIKMGDVSRLTHAKIVGNGNRLTVNEPAYSPLIGVSAAFTEISGRINNINIFSQTRIPPPVSQPTPITFFEGLKMHNATVAGENNSLTVLRPDQTGNETIYQVFNDLSHLSVLNCKDVKLKYISTAGSGGYVAIHAAEHVDVEDATFTQVMGSCNRVAAPNPGSASQIELLRDVGVVGANNRVTLSQTQLLGCFGEITLAKQPWLQANTPLTAVALGDVYTPALGLAVARPKVANDVDNKFIGNAATLTPNLLLDSYQGVSIMMPLDPSITLRDDDLIGRFVTISETGSLVFAKKRREIDGIITPQGQGIVQGTNLLQSQSLYQQDDFGRIIASSSTAEAILDYARALSNYRDIESFIRQQSPDTDLLPKLVEANLVKPLWADLVAVRLATQQIPLIAEPNPNTHDTPLAERVAMGYVGRFLVRQTGNLQIGSKATVLKTDRPELAGYATAARKGYRVVAIGPILADGTQTAYLLIK